MIEWSDEVRQQTPEFFCQEAYQKGKLLRQFKQQIKQTKG